MLDKRIFEIIKLENTNTRTRSSGAVAISTTGNLTTVLNTRLRVRKSMQACAALS